MTKYKKYHTAKVTSQKFCLGNKDFLPFCTSYLQSWMSRDTFLSVSSGYANVSSRSRTLKVSENGHVLIDA